MRAEGGHGDLGPFKNKREAAVLNAHSADDLAGSREAEASL